MSRARLSEKAPFPTHIFLGRAGEIEFWLGSHFSPLALERFAPWTSQMLLKDIPSLHLYYFFLYVKQHLYLSLLPSYH